MMDSILLGIFTGMPGLPELVIIGVVILLLFGNRLPSVMRSLGRGVVEFKKGVQGVEDEFNSAVEEAEKESKPKSDGDE